MKEYKKDYLAGGQARGWHTWYGAQTFGVHGLLGEYTRIGAQKVLGTQVLLGKQINGPQTKKGLQVLRGAQRGAHGTAEKGIQGRCIE